MAQSGDTPPTTLMIRNMPRKYTIWQLVSDLDNFVPRSAYDMVYLPWDEHSSSSMGFAFVNFLEADTAQSFRARMEGQPFRQIDSERFAKVLPAHVQGSAAYLRRFRGGRVQPNIEDCLLLLRQGAIVPIRSVLHTEHAESDGLATDVAHSPAVALEGMPSGCGDSCDANAAAVTVSAVPHSMAAASTGVDDRHATQHLRQTHAPATTRLSQAYIVVEAMEPPMPMAAPDASPPMPRFLSASGAQPSEAGARFQAPAESAPLRQHER
mmetsp:Transcript_11222/g.32021  ORF Transcript_11222/g.32021 Transcript_11222/m.32021 type:complete len:267 (+) Transcript_11222:62-862(+)